MTEEIKILVVRKISKLLAVDEDKVTEDAKLIEDLGADSLDMVELLMEFENAFNINIPDEAAEKIKTVGDIESYIDSVLPAKKS